MKNEPRLTSEELDRLEALAEKATPGPWHSGEPGGPAGPFWSLINPRCNIVAMQVTSEANAAFIAQSRTAVPALLSEVRRLRAALEHIAAEDCVNATGEFNGCLPENPCPACVAFLALEEQG